MPVGRKVAIALVAATIAAVLFTPFATVVDNNTGQQSVTNETVTAQLDEFVALDGYDIDKNSETVYGYNDTSGDYETVPDSNYQMDYEEGQVNVSSSSTLVQDGEDIKVSYKYRATDGATTTVSQLLPLFVGLLILGTLAAKVQQVM